MPNENQALVPVPKRPSVALVPSSQWDFPPPGPVQEEEAVPVSHYIWVLNRFRWRILFFVVLCVAATLLISSRLTPYYESTATIDIDRQVPAAAVGDGANNRVSSDDADQFLATQVRLVQSDSVLRPVVEKLGLPFPQGKIKTASGKSISSEEAPVSLPGLKITRMPNTYLLLVTYRSPDPYLAAEVANGIVQSYIEHAFKIRYQASRGLSSFMEKQTEELKQKMEKSSAALVKFEKDLNVIDPEAKTSILSSRLLQLNTEFTVAQADRISKESAYRSVKAGNLEAVQVTQQGEQLRRITDRLNEERAKFASVKTYYGDQHPEYLKAASEVSELEHQTEALRISIAKSVEQEYHQALSRESMIKSALAEAKDEYDRLNAHSFEYNALKQEAAGDKKLYEEMIRKIEEGGINASFRDNSIRLADPARPSLRPASPNLPLNGLMALLCSSLVAILAALSIDHMDQTARDPDQILRVLKTPVIGYLPAVTEWIRGGSTPATGIALLPAGATRQAREFEDAMRTLRDSILLPALAQQQLRSLLFTSSAPREGKTLTVCHFAVAHSKQGRRTLVIDGDIRRPRVHQQFGLPNAVGLTNVIDGEVPWRDALQQAPGVSNLFVLPAGHYSSRALDCIGTVLREIIDEITEEFDLVILDSPPALGFAEPLQMGALVDGVVVVALSGQTNRTAVASTVGGLRRVGANVLGIALNQVKIDVSDRYHYYHGKYYNRYYSPNESE